MSVAAASPSLELSGIDRRELARWGIAALLIVTFHLAVAYALQALRSTEPDGGPPPALMIELSPVAFAPPVPEEASIAEEVLPETAEPVEETEKVEKLPPDPTAVPETAQRVETEKPEAALAETVTETPQETMAETVEPETVEEAPQKPAETPPAEPLAPEVAETVAPEVALPIPQPRPIGPIAEQAEPVKPIEKKAAKQAEKAEKAPEKAPPKKKAAKQPTKSASAAKTEANPAQTAAAPKKSEGAAAPRVSPAKWQAKVLAWLNRHKRYPSGPKSRHEQGSVRVAFTIDASGRITSSRVTRSSGNDELDRAALDMVRRSSPVPAPPKEIARSGMSLTVPVQFSLK
jgi:protein TonB